MLSAQLPATMRAELWRLACRHDRSVSAEVRSAIRLHLLVADADESGREPPTLEAA
jgi:hypothetical protein